jgi:hypothetical protein
MGPVKKLEIVGGELSIGLARAGVADNKAAATPTVAAPTALHSERSVGRRAFAVRITFCMGHPQH